MFFYNEDDTEVSQVQPPSSEDPHFSNVSLLLPMDSNFSDSSVNNHAVTVNGNTSISTTESKYGGGSGEFDGSGDYITVSTNSSFDFGAEDFTIETWLYVRSIGPNWLSLYDNRNTNSAPCLALNVNPSKYPGMFVNGQHVLTSNIAIEFNNFYHIAFVRSSGVTSVYVNGQSGGSFNDGTSYSAPQVIIGTDMNYGATLDGFIDDFRITKGVARYTANFTPPTEAHPTQGETTPTPTTDPHFSNVSLLLPMDSNFSDSSVNNHAATTGGNVTVSSTESKFGGGSGYFDGNVNTGVSFPSSDSFDLRGVDWTMEAWIKPDGNYSDARMIISKRSWSVNYSYQVFLTNGTILFHNGFDGGVINNTSVSVQANVWSHLAIARYNGTITVYLNGQSLGSIVADTAFSNAPLGIGNVGDLNRHPFSGHIDDVRITKGVARYTANFTPPSEEHPTS